MNNTPKDDSDSQKEFRRTLVKLDLQLVLSTFGEDFYALRSIVNKYDPVGLLDDGYPGDEYDPEVKTIIVQLIKHMSVDQVYDLVINEFRCWFYEEVTDGCEEKYRQLSVDIHEWMKTVKTIHGS